MDKRGWQVKLFDPSLTRAIPERFRDEFFMIKRYTNLRILLVAVRKGMWALLQQNPPVLNWGCQLMEVVLYNGSKACSSSSSYLLRCGDDVCKIVEENSSISLIWRCN